VNTIIKEMDAAPADVRNVEIKQVAIPVHEDDRDTHAIGTGLGAAAGGIAGAAAGAAAAAATGIATGLVMGGPIGGAIGLVVGAVAGGVLGSEVGEAVNPTAEETYWSTAYRTEPYYNSSYAYDDYRPAYRVGYEGYGLHPGKSFDEVENYLQEDYIANRGNSRLNWGDARPATRSAWDRLGRGTVTLGS
jgi:uncharacterized protein YcfJ